MALLRTTTLVLLAIAALAPPAAAALLGSGQPLDRAFAVRLVLEELHAAGQGEQFEVRIDQPRLPLGNPGDSETEVVIEGLARDADSGRFQAQLVGWVDGVERFRLPLHGRAPALTLLPVLVRPIARGELVGAGDLDWQAMPAHRIRADTLTDPEQLIGAEAKRRLQPGRSLTARDLGPARLVRRGQPVRLVYARAGLHLQTLGTALADGTLGAAVTVANADSQRTLQGVVSGPDQVTVGPPPAAP